jgi:ribosomal-protein-alanine N-acetyltransferase
MHRDALFESFPVIETERCLLKEVPLACADDLFRIRSNPEGARLGPDAWADLKQAERRIREWHKWFLAREDVPWGIFLRGQDRLIGHIKYAYVRQYLGMLGYHLDMEYWNKGIMTEVLGAVVRFLYDRTDAYRLQATVHTEHRASVRVRAHRASGLGSRTREGRIQTRGGAPRAGVLAWAVLRPLHVCPTARRAARLAGDWRALAWFYRGVSGGEAGPQQEDHLAGAS